MRNVFILLLFLTTTTTNISYASFPVQFSTITNNDKLVGNKIDQYHNHLIKMGIDINSCKCEKFPAPPAIVTGIFNFSEILDPRSISYPFIYENTSGLGDGFTLIDSPVFI